MPDLFVLAGQSNMEGVGDLVDVEAPNPAIRLFAHGDDWKLAEEPLHWMIEAVDPVHWPADVAPGQLPRARADYRRTRTKGAGLGLPFAKTVSAATGREIDLLPVAHGGTSMQQWSPALKEQGGRSLYGAMLRRTALALETSPGAQLKAVLWYQGESDASAVDAPKYLQRMEELISSWRRDLGMPDLLFVIVQLGTFAVGGQASAAEALAWSNIREDQRRLPGLIPNLQMVSAIDLDLDDAIHIGTPGLKRLGRRAASVVLRHVYGQETPRPIEIGAARLQQSGAVRLSLRNVNGALVVVDPAGRIPGFGLAYGSDFIYDVFYGVKIDPATPSDLLLFPRDAITTKAKLVYGFGHFPFCQLVDDADMAVPAFGPLDISF